MEAWRVSKELFKDKYLEDIHKIDYVTLENRH